MLAIIVVDTRNNANAARVRPVNDASEQYTTATRRFFPTAIRPLNQQGEQRS